MNEYYKYLLTGVLSAGLTYFFSYNHYNKFITACNQDVTDLQTSIYNLNLRLEEANKVYELVERKEKVLRYKEKTLKSEKELSEEKDKIIQDLIIIKSEYESKKNSLDSLKEKLPNRNGQQLINSIKIKTQI